MASGKSKNGKSIHCIGLYDNNNSAIPTAIPMAATTAATTLRRRDFFVINCLENQVMASFACNLNDSYLRSSIFPTGAIV